MNLVSCSCALKPCLFFRLISGLQSHQDLVQPSGQGHGNHQHNVATTYVTGYPTTLIVVSKILVYNSNFFSLKSADPAQRDASLLQHMLRQIRHSSFDFFAHTRIFGIGIHRCTWYFFHECIIMRINWSILLNNLCNSRAITKILEL